MKQKILATLIFCLLFTGFVFSQNRPSKHSKDGDKKRPTAEEMVKRDMNMFQQELNLTETQKTFTQKILEDSYKKMEELFKSGSKDRDEITKIMDEKDENLKNVFTDDQWAKYQLIKDKRKDKHDINGDDKQSPPPDRQ